MGFFSSTKDLSVYPMGKGQRDRLSGAEYDQQMGLYRSDPNRFWGGSFQDWGRDTGLNSLNPAGGLSWGNLTGGSGGGPGGGGGGGAVGYGASAGHATAGHGAAEYIDLGAEPYQTAMSERIRQGFAGHLAQGQDAQTGAAVRRLNASAALGGVTPMARQYLEQEARRNAADTIGRETAGFEGDYYRGALDRQATARGTNAQLGTSVSMGNAGNDTQASIANAGNETSASIATAGNRTSASGQNAAIGAASAGQRSAQEADAARFLLGMYDRGQDRDLERYGMLHNRYMDYQKPVATKVQGPGWGTSLIGAGVGAAMGYATGGASMALGGGLAGFGNPGAATQSYFNRMNPQQPR